MALDQAQLLFFSSTEPKVEFSDESVQSVVLDGVNGLSGLPTPISSGSGL